MSNHYEVLGVGIEASADEIGAAYRLLARRLHPDLNPEGAEAFAVVNAAYSILGDADARLLYDAQRASGGAPEGTPEPDDDYVDDVEWVDVVIDDVDDVVAADEVPADGLLGRWARGLGAVLALVVLLIVSRYMLPAGLSSGLGGQVPLLATLAIALVYGLKRAGIVMWLARIWLVFAALAPVGFMGLWPWNGLAGELGWAAWACPLAGVASVVLRGARFPR